MAGQSVVEKLHQLRQSMALGSSMVEDNKLSERALLASAWTQRLPGRPGVHPVRESNTGEGGALTQCTRSMASGRRGPG